MLNLQQIAIARGAQNLIENINFSLFAKQVIGLIGANGSGKSSLFMVIKGELEAAKGTIEISKHLKMQFLAQETEALPISAIRFVIAGDSKLDRILTRLAQAEQDENYDVVMHCHQQLSDCDGYTAEARAAKILAGLGFTNEQLEQPVASFSGGWRMRLNLAKCLFSPSDILLLDEPTNHLDMEAIIWLEDFLRQYAGGILVVSHDRDFLDNIVTHIAHVENHQLKLYTGNFSHFEVERANAIRLQNAAHRNQQAQINHMMKFVTRFGAKANKAKQAQSRLKAIEKMDLIKPIYEKSPFTFCFKKPKTMPNPMLKMDRVSFGYDEKPVISQIQFSLMPGQRLGLLGVNGAGKSTFIKGLCGMLPPLNGELERFPGTSIGYFAQHQVDHLDMDESPYSLLKDIASETSERELIAYLGRYNFNRDKSLSALKYFSGGEKARVALALIIWQRPNLLLLDEPTNHLDLEMRQALVFALEEYEGSLIVVSHDRYLLRTLVDELYLIKAGRLMRFNGTVEDYHVE